MKIAAMFGEKKGGLIDVPDLKATENFALVKVLVVPMCTEFKMFANGHKGQGFGHEAAGEVMVAGGSGHLKAGDRVVVMPLYGCGTCELCLRGDYIFCRESFNAAKVTGSDAGHYTYGQYLLKPDHLLVRIPDDISIEHGSMACCGLGPTFGAMQRMGVNKFDTVVITGMGPVGLGGVVNAVFRGARVIAVESHPYRAELAKQLGAHEIVDPRDNTAAVKRIDDLTDGKGADQAIDCSGVAAAQRLLIDSVKRRGQVAFVGEAGELAIKVSDDMIRKGLTLVGSWHFNLGDSFQLMEVIRGSHRLLDKLITHTFPMSRVQEAWELQTRGDCGKVLLNPWEN
jgi:L-iditol 2-dehydrogenase